MNKLRILWLFLAVLGVAPALLLIVILFPIALTLSLLSYLYKQMLYLFIGYVDGLVRWIEEV